jgi:polar amino acid transport system permease protein
MTDLALLSFGPDGWGDELLAGLRVTLLLAAATAPLALAIGFLLALARRSERRAARIPATLFATVVKGLPELITLFIVYYGLSLGLTKLLALVSDVAVSVPAFLAGMIALGVVSSSYASEVFMSALAGVPKGQREAGEALGLRPRPIWWKIILPQVLRLALPGLSNLWFVLLKDTALVAVIALPDLLRRTFIAANTSKQPFFFYLVAILIYFAVSLVSQAIFTLIEHRLARGTQR